MTRRTHARGEGTIELHGGRWRIRLRLPDGTRRSIYADVGATRKEADALREAALRELAGTTNDPKSGGVTLGAWGERWLDEREQTHRDAHGDRQRWAQHVASEPIARVRLDALGAAHIRTWLDGLASRCTARQTARNVHTTLRAAIRGAQRARAITATRMLELLAEPLPLMRVETSVELDERIAYLTDEQIAAVLQLDGLSPEQVSAFVVGVWTGMRAGELHGLTWERIRLDDARPHVVVARSRTGAVKSGKVARVPLLEPARAVLRARWEKRGRPASGLVWPADCGSTHARGYDWGWSDHRQRIGGEMRVRPGIAARAGILGVTWKDATRHTCGVHLLRGTWAPDIVPAPYRIEEVSRFLRHSSITVTERHYAHLALDSLPVTMPAPLAGPFENGPNGPNGPVFASHTRDLNSGPTVYETRASTNGFKGLDGKWDQRGPMTGEELRELARQVLRCIALRDAAGLVDPAAALAVAVLDADSRETPAAVVSLQAVRQLRLLRSA